jgi:hypothetical protein
MADIPLTVGAAGLFLAGFVGWCAGRRRVSTGFERVPVRTDRSASVVRRGADPLGHSR